MTRANNFDFLRAIAALSVLYGHMFVLMGEPVPMLLGTSLHGLGIDIFFCISGYLVTLSWQADPAPARFIRRRALRILPGLAGVLAFSVFVLGPLVTTLPLTAYFGAPATWRYLGNIVLFPRISHNLPGVFADTPFPNAVNGSLWSLPVEVLMYVMSVTIGLTALGLLRLKLPRRLAGPLLWHLAAGAGLWAFLMAVEASGRPGFFVGSTDLTNIAGLGLYYISGAVLALSPRRLALRTDIGLLVVAVLVVMPASAVPFAPRAFLFAYAVLAFCNGASFAGFARPGDFSYGLYLYAFPVQQVVASNFHGLIGVHLAALLSAAGALALAVLSWHFIEAPALRLKPRRPPKKSPPAA